MAFFDTSKISEGKIYKRSCIGNGYNSYLVRRINNEEEYVPNEFSKKVCIGNCFC